MSKSLVIVESPSKSKTIEKYLGKDYVVMASKGHVVDLPKSGLGVDVENNFEPEYETIARQKKTISNLKKILKDVDEVIIAVDPDREGEAIGWHVASSLGLINLEGKRKKNSKELKRIVFTEITKEAVKGALEKPRELDLNLLHAQQARRILDRLVGYKLSPLLWKKIRYGLSAGRVQSVAVKLIVDREVEREKFVPDEYWKMQAHLSSKKNSSAANKTEVKIVKDEESIPELAEDEIKFLLFKLGEGKVELTDEKLPKKILAEIQDKKWVIQNIEKKKTKRNPKPPFTTSSLQQTAANWFGFSAKKTMTLAQKLYENGLITYMRTDSTNLSNSALESARKYIEGEFGKKFLPEKAKQYKTKVKVAQEAHEAIRPANFSVRASGVKLDKDYQRLYQLIWQRALASQMESAELENMTIDIHIEVAGFDYKYVVFRATGQRVIFPGYLEVYPEKVSENVLPELQKGDELPLQTLIASQHFTQPPPRFSEATLIKELEKHGIGRPSTYAPIISTIQGRNYVEKEGAYFHPTDTGVVVTKLLSSNFPEVVDTDFTADMEEDLDEIANGGKDWRDLLSDFYGPFSKKLDKKEDSLSREDFTVLGDAPEDLKCPDCGSKMVIKLGKYGRFYSCSKFPDCKGMRAIDGKTNEELENEAYTDDFKQMYNPPPQTDDKRDYILKSGRFGKFWAHPDYPKVKDAKPLEYRPEKLRELFGEPPLTDDGREFQFRTGKFGKFWAHPDYPKVKKTVRIKEEK